MNEPYRALIIEYAQAKMDFDAHRREEGDAAGWCVRFARLVQAEQALIILAFEQLDTMRQKE